jgi:peptidoglycan/xylan/chitin deacetylase (PgdA/CDA1 family)
MLHESHEGFDAPEFLRQFLAAADDHHLRTVTYSQLEADPSLLASGAGQLLIITIDDVFLQSRLDPSILEMIGILLEAKAVAVLGVVTEGRAASTDTATTLRELAALGWEIATHGDSHRDLHEIEMESPGHVRYDIRDSKEKLADAVGVQAQVLILPFGQMVDDARLLHKEGIKWAVGISGGGTIDLTDRLIYVGRQPPLSDAVQTLEVMLRPFPDSK